MFFRASSKEGGSCMTSNSSRTQMDDVWLLSDGTPVSQVQPSVFSLSPSRPRAPVWDLRSATLTRRLS